MNHQLRAMSTIQLCGVVDCINPQSPDYEAVLAELKLRRQTTIGADIINRYSKWSK